jgi:hypothetical protein
MTAHLPHDKNARTRRTSNNRREPLHPDAVRFLTALPDDACDRDAHGLEYGPSIEALVDIFEREERAGQQQPVKKA